VVKFQTIVREEREIVVGRLKVQTLLPPPAEHAFILRRYDTGAISVTTMYKAAFPSATPEEEEREMKWIKSSFDMNGMNGSRTCNAVKLAGNWIPPTLATHLAPAYKLSPWIDAMARAGPEQGVAYRKSQRSQQAAEAVAANKRRMEQERLAAEAGGAAGNTINNANNNLAVPVLGPPIFTRSSTRASPRRAAAAPAAAPAPSTPSAPAAKRTRRETSAKAEEGSSRTQVKPEEASTGTRNDAAVAGTGNDTVQVTLQAVTEVRAPTGTDIDAEAQIAESKAMVMRVKEEALARSRAGESAEDMGLVEPASSSGSNVPRGTKRTAETAETETSGFVGGISPAPAAPKSALKPSAVPAPQRVIAGNKRVVKPEVAARRQLAWGGLALGAGVALTYLAGTFF